DLLFDLGARDAGAKLDRAIIALALLTVVVAIGHAAHAFVQPLAGEIALLDEARWRVARLGRQLAQRILSLDLGVMRRNGAACARGDLAHVVAELLDLAEE